MKKNKALRTMVCSAGLMIMTAIPAFAADGWQQDSGQNWFYMEQDKKVVNQWVQWPDGTARYVGGNGLIVKNNWVNFEGDRYRVKEDGTRYENEWFGLEYQANQPAGKPGTTWYYAGEGGKLLINGWYPIGGRYYYFYQNGNSPRKTFLVVDEKRYYVDENGARMDQGWFSIENVNGKGVSYTNTYYATEDGSLLTNGWHKVEEKEYYFDQNGTVYLDRWFNVDGKRSYTDENGEGRIGWFSVTGTNSNGQEYTNWYYAREDKTMLRDGWRELDGAWYFFDANGLNYRERWYVDPQGERYYLDKEGILQDDGWFKIERTNASTGEIVEYWYYAQESGAVLKNGYKTIGDKKYYFDANGYNYRKRWMTTEEKRRYLGEDGTLQENQWFFIKGVNSRDEEYINWYYAGKDGYIYTDDWYKIDGKRYCFNSGGVMRTGWLTEVADNDEDEDSYYYCGEDGARAIGWRWLEIPESWMDNEDVGNYVTDYGQYAWFYFHESSGRKKRSSGGKQEVQIGGVTYCMDGNGILYSGWVKLSSTSPEIRGYRYFTEPESENHETFTGGEKLKSTWIKSHGPDDLDVSGQEEWYYLDNTGRPICGPNDSYEVKKIQGDSYVFDMYGVAQYGLVEVNHEFYYCGTVDGNRKCVTGKVSVADGIDSGHSQYYFDKDGQGVTGVKDGYFYYKGKLQKADSKSKYQVFDIPDVGKRLVNASGKVVKGKSVTDGNDDKWKVNASGKIEEYGSDEVAEIVAPEATSSY